MRTYFFLLLLPFSQISFAQDSTYLKKESNKELLEFGITNSVIFNYSEMIPLTSNSNVVTKKYAVSSYCPTLTLRVRNRFRYFQLCLDNLLVGNSLGVLIQNKSGMPREASFQLSKRSSRLVLGYGHYISRKHVHLSFDLGVSYYLNFNLGESGVFSYVADSTDNVSIGYDVRSAPNRGLGIASNAAISFPIRAKRPFLLSVVAGVNYGLQSLVTGKYNLLHEGTLSQFEMINRGTTFSVGLSVMLPLNRKKDFSAFY